MSGQFGTSGNYQAGANAGVNTQATTGLAGQAYGQAHQAGQTAYGAGQQAYGQAAGSLHNQGSHNAQGGLNT